MSLECPRHGRERYFSVKAIVKSIIFPKKLSRQLSSQLCNNKNFFKAIVKSIFFSNKFDKAIVKSIVLPKKFFKPIVKSIIC